MEFLLAGEKTLADDGRVVALAVHLSHTPPLHHGQDGQEWSMEHILVTNNEVDNDIDIFDS